MTIDDIDAFVSSMDGVVVLRPGPGDGTPEIAWGDHFFYYAPDGELSGQPFATVVTKDYPDDERSRLNEPGAFRVNVAAGRESFVAWVGREPRDPVSDSEDPSVRDQVVAHPVYGELGWLCVVDPGPATDQIVRELLATAHQLAAGRYDRRASH